MDGGRQFVATQSPPFVRQTNLLNFFKDNYPSK